MYSASGISKHYGGVQALAGVDLELRGGEVHGLLGANGAGKSTLMKILVGAEEPTTGSLQLDGHEIQLGSLAHARSRGIALVSQELRLYPHLDVLQNIFLGREPRHAGLIVDRRRMVKDSRRALEAVGLEVDLTRPLSRLTLAEQQLVEIARALLEEPKVILLDEPTSALQAAETARLLGVVRSLRDRGVAVVYVSHFLEDTFEVADTLTVLRDGRVAISSCPRADITISQAVAAMLGTHQPGETPNKPSRLPRRSNGPSTTALRFAGVTMNGDLNDFDLTADAGEVVGLAGLAGAGQHCVLESVFGHRRISGGTIVMPDGRRAPRTPGAAVQAGVAFVASDRKRLGLLLEKPIYENICTVVAGPLGRMGAMPKQSEMIARTNHWARELNIRMSSPRQIVGQLSGGNQQKVVFAKWLEADPKIVLMDDPSRGVDVGAKMEMHTIIRRIAAEDRIVLVTSSDLEELAAVCDRVVVFFRGRSVGELSGDDLTEAGLLEAINVGRLVNVENAHTAIELR